MGIDQDIQFSPWYSTSFRVRYQESDKMAVVYHANYLNWFEIGRTEMIRELGISYHSMEEEGLFLPVTELDMKFIQPARYDDMITIFTRMTLFTKLRINYTYEIRKLSTEEREKLITSRPLIGGILPGELLVTGSTGHVWLNHEWKPVRLDKYSPKLYAALDKSFAEGGG